MSDCPFCPIPAPILREWGVTNPIVAFRPLNPVTPLHTLIVPTRHVEHFATEPALSAEVMRCAALWCSDMEGVDFNIITSKGPSATQTVRHLHVHVVPRHTDDGLHLPWTGQTSGMFFGKPSLQDCAAP